MIIRYSGYNQPMKAVGIIGIALSNLSLLIFWTRDLLRKLICPVFKVWIQSRSFFNNILSIAPAWIIAWQKDLLYQVFVFDLRSSWNKNNGVYLQEDYNSKRLDKTLE